MIITYYEICKNCKNYVPLYTKEKDRFKTISGYCIYKTKSARSKPFTDGKTCEFKDVCENKDDANEPIRNTILKIHKQLTQILYVLESEK